MFTSNGQMHIFVFFVSYLLAAGFLKKLRNLRDSRNFSNKNSLNFNRCGTNSLYYIITWKLCAVFMTKTWLKSFTTSFYLSLDSSENRDPEEPVADCQHDISGHIWSLPNREQCSQGVGGDCWSKFQPQWWLPQWCSHGRKWTQVRKMLPFFSCAQKWAKNCHTQYLIKTVHNQTLYCIKTTH